jgi:glycosyltransferase involved in cell wall biosynthesis
MKNLIVNATICDIKPTGLGIYTLNVAKELCKNKDIKLEVIINQKIGQKYLEKQNINVFPSPSMLLSNKGWVAQLARIFYLNIKLLFLSRKNNVVLNTVPEGSLFIQNQVTVIHDILPILFKKEYSKSYYYYKYYVPLILKRSKKIVVPSQSTKNDIVNMYKIKSDKVIIAPNGYDSHHFTPGTINDVDLLKRKYGVDEYFLYVGNMYPHKNLSRVIKSFISINDQYPEIKLLIVGDKSHWNYKNIKYQVDINKMNDTIKFLDYVSYEELPVLYSGALAFVYPSLYEGFGLPIIEAMACGSPVITSNLSSLKEIANDSALTINPESVDELSGAMRKIINDKSLRSTLITKALKHVKNYSWEKTVKIIYSQL